MKDSFKTGFSFGLTSAIITTLGLMVGLQAGTQSQLAVVGGILTIAVADAFSDALGIHISEESEKENKPRQVWEATLATFLAKFFFALTFIIPVLLLSLNLAVFLSVFWGFMCLGVFSYFLAKKGKTKPGKVIFEHLLIAILVIGITRFLGQLIAFIFS